MCDKMSFPTIGKTIFPTFHAFMYIAHIFINISYLFDCIFYFSILNCCDVLGALLSVWFFCSKFSILLRVGEVWFAPKQVYIYTGESTVLGRTRFIGGHYTLYSSFK